MEMEISEKESRMLLLAEVELNACNMLNGEKFCKKNQSWLEIVFPKSTTNVDDNNKLPNFGQVNLDEKSNNNQAIL